MPAGNGCGCARDTRRAIELEPATEGHAAVGSAADGERKERPARTRPPPPRAARGPLREMPAPALSTHLLPQGEACGPHPSALGDYHLTEPGLSSAPQPAPQATFKDVIAAVTPELALTW